MLRRNAAPTLALLILSLLGVACTSTTVLGEGRLGAPTETATEAETDRGDREIPDGESDTATGPSDEDALPDAAEDEFASLGDDALIGAWSDECSDGSDLACDVLFTITERGSEAEALAQTCGGRRDVEVRFCTPDIAAFEDRLWFDAESPGLPDVVEDCESGDLISCDFLYFRSEVGSTYEALGNSCGNRVAIAVPDCRSALAE